jgi:hypothetical protein
MNRTEHQRYNCPVLGGVALIQITKRYLTSDEMPQPILRSTEFTNCRDMLRCGIAKRTGNVFIPNWTLCPAHPTYKKSV